MTADDIRRAGAEVHIHLGTVHAALTYVTRLRGGLRWSGTLIGSITTALNKEIEGVPGAAGEAIKEFIELLLNATEPREGGQDKGEPA